MTLLLSQSGRLSFAFSILNVTLRSGSFILSLARFDLFVSDDAFECLNPIAEGSIKACLVLALVANHQPLSLRLTQAFRI
ncbi:hypothetical protein D3C81_1423000 [compost metagenome]